MADTDYSTSASRTSDAVEGTSEWVDTYEGIQDTVADSDGELPTLIKAQMDMTDADATKEVKVGQPKSVQKQEKALAGETGKAGG